MRTAPLGTQADIQAALESLDLFWRSSRRSRKLKVMDQLDDALARALVEAAPDALVLVDSNGRIVFLNAQSEAMFGYARAELVGQPVEVLVPDGLRAAHAEKRAAFTAAPRTRPMGLGLSLTGRRRDGTEIPIEVSLSPVQTRDGFFVAAALRDVSARHLIERTLRDAEERFRLTFDEAPIGMALAGLDGRFLRVNRSLCQITGYSRQELTVLTTLAITHPDDLDSDRTLTGQLERGEIPHYQLAKRYIRKDSRVVDAILNKLLVRDSEGKPLHYIVQVEDITERKRAEQALRRSEESLARAQRIARVGSWDWDLRTNEVSRSAELFELCGLKPDPKYVQARSLLDLVHPQDREAADAAVNEAVREARGFQLEYRLLRADGAERIISSQGDVVLEQGRAVRMVGTAMDITERKHLERAREESRRWLYALLDQCPIGIMLVQGAHGEHVEFNKHAQSFIRQSDDCSGQITDLLLWNERGQPLASENHPGVRALLGKHTSAMELTLPNADGLAVPILLDAAPIVDDNGATQGAVVVFQDITLLKQLERLRTEWNAIVAHDLRQPLNAISLCAQLLARDEPDVSGLRKPIAQIIRSAMHLNRMIQDLLDFSRIEAHQFTLMRQPVDLSTLIRRSVEAVALVTQDRRFDLHIPSEIPIIDVDADRIVQVMDNLLSNAIKYAEPGTPIGIHVEQDGEEVRVAVTNVGKGIAREDLPTLFQRFQRTEDAKRGPLKGVGLGLYIVHELIKAHGGDVQVESTSGGMTTFRFTLPMTNKPPTALSPKAHEAN